MIYNKATSRTWQQSLKSGNIAEDVFEQHMDLLGNEIKDVRDDPAYRKIDVDYLTYIDDKEIKVEIKCDYCFGNYNFDKQRLFIETVQNRDIKSVGWYYASKCDVLGIYDYVNKTMYYMQMDDLREYIKLYCSNSSRIMYIQIKNGAEGYGVNLSKFWDWLIQNDKFNKIYINE